VTWVLFDLNGTLLDPGAMGEPWDDPAIGVEALDGAVFQAMADTLSGAFAPFPAYLQAALARRVALAGLDPAPLAEAAERAGRLPPFPDAAPALDRVAAAGRRLAVVTNSAAEAAEAALDAGGLLGRFERVLGADAVRAYKPDARVYRHALDELGAAPADAWLVAAHWWDVAGAKRVGLRGAWVSRGRGWLPATAPEPDVCAGDLDEAAAGILSA
jgi:2-haloacid dehalogenase